MSGGAGPDDDPAALRSEAACRFFAAVMRRELRRGFRAVRLARPGLPDLPPDRPVMVLSTHPSWWDPALFIALHDRFFPGRIGFGPMDARMVRKFRFMARIGVFGVPQDAGARGAAVFLRRARPILSAPDRVLWITPQGRFVDPRERPLGLRPGAAHLLVRMPQVLALPLALDYPFWDEKRPEALMAFGAPVEARPGEGAAALNDRLEAALADTADRLAARAVARDPAPFETLLGGAEGTGGIYGVWQRLRGRGRVPA
ncbi:lysophospholipid acyltransferase family protein [Wenxinia saemankumensis]|uniref:1-acyl-sn-glycerol-3-phosphate acyltransferase n=1 Tax=Wenxinia saemankumensis TaxID=1447782 RepID=A0A1M6D1T8_9RHOB|nr:lysophospholipid acyltransferase family protein [Wenxinia saemankumensis]SHI66958.1 1-acyl-sn-glycerol-3-phosphate acyltransferase [Wenxinia saemankumensis]